ncbi:MAG: hypothetical protein PVH77_01605, partial [Phycisphaerales bacterium]
MKRFKNLITIVAAITMLLAVRAVSQMKEDEPIVPKKKMMLWNGKDFTGWKLFVGDSEHDVKKTW